MRLRYLANARLPTEKAHGYQITKMCEAFAGLGADVELWHARRHQTDPALTRTSVFDYYGVPPVFRVRRLPNVDVLRLATVPGFRWTRRLVPLQQLGWACAVARRASRAPGGLWYARDPTVALALAGHGLPTVFEAHDVPRGPGRSLLRRLATRRGLRRAAGVTAGIVEDLAGLGFARERLLVLPDAVDLALFGAAPSRADARRALDFPADRPIVGYVGRFTTMDREKGLPELVAAVGVLAPVGGREPLLVAVGGPMDRVSRYLAHACAAGIPLTRLRFVDRVPNRQVPTWIAAFDVAVLPAPDAPHHARYASPMKLFEYMGAGAAIVASDLPAIREVLRDGENARLVPAGDPTALAAGLAAVLGDPALAARLGARARAESTRYTWAARARAVLAGLEPATW